MSSSDSFMEDFVSGSEAFAKKNQYSRRWQQIWQGMFGADDDGYTDFMTFGFAEQRFKARVAPCMGICKKKS